MGLFRKHAVGLDISDRSIEAVLINKRGSSSELVSYGRILIPAGVVVNGYVERRNDLIQLIRKLLADGMNPPLPKGMKRVILSLPESRVFSHVFQVPRIADTRELEKTLAFEADAYFPYPHEDMIGTMAVTAKKPDTKDIYYSAVHKETLKSYLNMFHQAGIDLEVVEAESSAIARALLQPDERSPVVVVDIGARVTDLTVIDRNGPQFSETLNAAGDVFTNIITEKLNLPFDEAEQLKKDNGITGKMAPEIEDAIKAEIGRLAADIHKAIDFFEKRSGRVIEKVLLAGGSSLLPGLKEHLEEALITPEKDIDVNLGDPWFGLTMSAPDLQESVSNRGILMATAIGLGLRGAGVRKFPELNFLDNAHELLGQVKKGKGKKRGRSLADLPPWLIALFGFLFFIATALGTWYVAFRFYVQRVPTAPAVIGEESVPEAGSVEIEIEATLGNAFSEEQMNLRSTPIEIEVTASRTFTHEGTEAPGKAGGIVELINESTSGQTLVATTRLLSEKDVLFRLVDRVFIPAGGRLSARVEADQEGPEGDIAPSRFIIPGLSPAAQQVIYAESSEAMTGGIRFEGTPLTQEEYDEARSELSVEAGAGLFDEALAKGGEEFILEETLLTADAVTVISGPVVGQPTGDFRMEVRATGRVLGISKEEVDALLRKHLEASDPELAEQARIGRVVVTVTEPPGEDGTAGLRITATASP